MSTKDIIERAVSQMEAWAADPGHGYDQTLRWGERGDYDCSSAVITAWELAGVPVKTGGATYTGNMYPVFLALGFRDITAQVNRSTGDGLQRGDVLLNRAHHTALYCGGSMEVEASINEMGTATGGAPGDQTGREFLIRSYRNYPWDCVLRYMGGEDEPEIPAIDPPPEMVDVQLPVLHNGMGGAAVAAMQGILHAKKYSLGPYGVDGDFGVATRAAVTNFQIRSGLDPDGICGPETWRKLLN